MKSFDFWRFENRWNRSVGRTNINQLDIALWPRVEQRKLILAKKNTKKTNRQEESPEKKQKNKNKKNNKKTKKQ